MHFAAEYPGILHNHRLGEKSMTLFAVIVALGTALFTLGYYLGNQMGRTEHIRRRLQELRDNQIRG